MEEWYADSENVYIITDVCEGGELFDLVKAAGGCKRRRALSLHEFIQDLLCRHLVQASIDQKQPIPEAGGGDHKLKPYSIRN